MVDASSRQVPAPRCRAHGALAATVRRAERASDKSARPSGGASRGNAQATAAVATQSSRAKRVRRKVEVARLRAEAETLEAKLLALRELWKQQAARAMCGTAAPYRASGPRWRSIAAHEEQLLREAARTNDELRAEYQSQKRMARDLHKILMKRMALAAKFDYAFYRMQQPDTAQLLANSVFDRLVRDLAPMSDALEHVQGLLVQQALHHATPVFREWNVRDDDPEAHAGLSLELVDSHALPFDFALVNDMMRRQFGEDNINRPNKSFSEYFHHAGDVTVHQSIVRYSNNSHGRGSVRLREVVRSVGVSATHAVYLSMKLIEPSTDAGEPIHAITIREKTWTVVRGSRESGEGAMTFVQSYHTMAPEVVHEGFEREWSRKKIEGKLIPAWNMSLGVVHRRLESDLLEQSMRRSLRIVSSSANA